MIYRNKQIEAIYLFVFGLGGALALTGYESNASMGDRLTPVAISALSFFFAWRGTSSASVRIVREKLVVRKDLLRTSRVSLGDISRAFVQPASNGLSRRNILHLETFSGKVMKVDEVSGPPGELDGSTEVERAAAAINQKLSEHRGTLRSSGSGSTQSNGRGSTDQVEAEFLVGDDGPRGEE